MRRPWPVRGFVRRRALGLLVSALLSAVSACSTATAPITDAADASAPYLSTFARLERWATRLSNSDVRLRGRSALSEATFAPFRADESVLWADVRVDEQHLQYEQPAPSETLRYVTIDAPSVGRVWVALAEDCQARGRVGPRAGAGAKLARQALACVVIARPGVGARASTFRVAFARTPASLELKPSTPNKRPELEVSERGKVGHRAQPRALPKALATKH